MTRKVRYLGDVNCGPSPSIFGDLGTLRGESDQGMCMLFDDDFATPPILTSGTNAMGYLMLSTNATATGLDASANDTENELGVLHIDVLDAAADVANIQWGDGNQWVINGGRNSTGNTSKLGYEVRFKQNLVNANSIMTMVGFFEGPVATTSQDADGEIVNSKSFVGFRALKADPNKLDVVYQATADNSVTVVAANAATLVAGTYTKLGLLADPFELDSSKAISFFQDGVAVAYANTTQVDAALFPEGEPVVPVIGFQAGAGTATGTANIDRVTGVMFKNDIQ